MPEKNSNDRPFFLTRQIANLMEDFARETSHSSSVFLLYGDALVGKSRLLDELTRRYFSGNVIHRIDFSTDKMLTDEESSLADQSSSEMASKIRQLAQDASGQDIFIFDHFESASNKSRHQVFQCWATDGLDKKLNFIIAADTSHFDEVRQLANQYQVNVKSFQLKPFAPDEIESFVLNYLFSTESSGRLLIPPNIQKELRDSQGVVGGIIGLVSRESIGAAITLDDKPATYGKPLILAGALLVILLVSILLNPLSNQKDELPYASTESDVSDSSTVKEEAIEVEIDDSLPMESPTKERSAIKADDSDLSKLSTNQSIAEDSLVLLKPESSRTKPEKTGGSRLNTEQEFVKGDQDGVTLNQVASAPVIDTESQPELTEQNGQDLRHFEQELNTSLNWINDSDKDSATIQIMSIGFDRFTYSSYYDFLNKLQRQDIDVSMIRIFQTRVGGLLVYSILYGEYDNRREASKIIQLLPEALKIANPFPRTFGGIQAEINNENIPE